MGLLSGRIVEERKNYYIVDTPKGELRALLKGVIRKKHKRLSVGDIVNVEIYDEEKSEALIRSVEKRKNELPKPVVANIDQVLFVNCYIEPILDFTYIDRFLFAASVNGISVKMIFNKIDLLEEYDWIEMRAIAEDYRKCGYEILFSSIEDDESVEQIREKCGGKLTVFAGPSGVGKSSLMKKLFPDLEFVTNELSEQIQRGRNTTTHTALFTLGENSYIADTPGFSYLKIPKIEACNVREHFPEILEASQECKFSNCTHINEPSCAVKELAKTNEIIKSRYNSYVDLVELMDNAAKDFSGRGGKYI
jgi:ribosome biogenesis GTPase